MGSISDEFDRAFFSEKGAAEEKAKAQAKKEDSVSKKFMDGVMQQANAAMNAQMVAVAMGEYNGAKQLENEKAKKEIADDKKAQAEIERGSIDDEMNEKSNDRVMTESQANESSIESSSIDRLDDERAKRQAHQEAVFDEKFSHKYNNMLEENSTQVDGPEMGE